MDKPVLGFFPVATSARTLEYVCLIVTCGAIGMASKMGCKSYGKFAIARSTSEMAFYCLMAPAAFCDSSHGRPNRGCGQTSNGKLWVIRVVVGMPGVGEDRKLSRTMICGRLAVQARRDHRADDCHRAFLSPSW
jgi:hypothetical protein